MNSIKKIYTTFPINKPFLTIFFTIAISLFFLIGSSWIVIDDDFVKMFPDDIPSKKVWDEIQNEFGSTEYLIVAVGHDEILNDTTFYNRVVRFSNELKILEDQSANKLIDKVISINDSDILDSGNSKNNLDDYNHLLKKQFINYSLYIHC